MKARERRVKPSAFNIPLSATFSKEACVVKPLIPCDWVRIIFVYSTKKKISYISKTIFRKILKFNETKMKFVLDLIMLEI